MEIPAEPMVQGIYNHAVLEDPELKNLSYTEHFMITVFECNMHKWIF